MNRLRKHTLSFSNAFAGISEAFKTQVNLKIHALIAITAITLGFYLKISTTEFLILILTIGTVVVAEMANTAIEQLSDAVTRDHNDYIKMAKDVAAGSVLLTAAFSVIIGIIIFIPKLALLINN